MHIILTDMYKSWTQHWQLNPVRDGIRGGSEIFFRLLRLVFISWFSFFLARFSTTSCAVIGNISWKSLPVVSHRRLSNRSCIHISHGDKFQTQDKAEIISLNIWSATITELTSMITFNIKIERTMDYLHLVPGIAYAMIIFPTQHYTLHY